MKQEILDKKREIRDRIKTIKAEILDLRKKTDSYNLEAQQLQQKMAVNNTEIIKKQGALEELEGQVKE